MCKKDHTKQINCKRCNQFFTPTAGFKNYCSHVCKFSTRPVSTESVEKRAKALSKKIEFICQNPECKIHFTDKPSSKRKYCSPSCASKTRMNDPNVKAKYREKAIQQGLGGNVSRGKHGYYISPIAGKVFLESSYEFQVAQSLDENGIKWIRPSKKDALVYQFPEENKTRRYFPDFYLPDYDVYLDPKNDYRIKKDLRKIRLVRQKYNVRVFVLKSDELYWDAISSLIGINKPISNFFKTVKDVVQSKAA